MNCQLCQRQTISIYKCTNCNRVWCLECYKREMLDGFGIVECCCGLLKGFRMSCDELERMSKIIDMRMKGIHENY